MNFPEFHSPFYISVKSSLLYIYICSMYRLCFLPVFFGGRENTRAYLRFSFSLDLIGTFPSMFDSLW